MAMIINGQLFQKDIERIFNQLSIKGFKDLLKEFIVNDNDGKPNILDATGIVVKTNKEIVWQLYSFE